MKIFGTKNNSAESFSLIDVSFVCDRQELDDFIKYLKFVKSEADKAATSLQKNTSVDTGTSPHWHYNIWDKKMKGQKPSEDFPDITVSIPFSRREEKGKLVWVDGLCEKKKAELEEARDFNRVLTKTELNKLNQEIKAKFCYDKAKDSPTVNGEIETFVLQGKDAARIAEEMQKVIRKTDKTFIVTGVSNWKKKDWATETNTLNLEDPEDYELYTNKSFSWFIYASADGTITFGGKSLVGKVKSLLTAGEDHAKRF